MNRTLTLLSALLLALSMTGCPSGIGDDDDDATACSSTETEYTCENGYCTCDDDGTSCTDPEDTTAEDAMNCDNACEECVD